MAIKTTEIIHLQRALTIRQPFAELVVRGHKLVENRSWPVPKTVKMPVWIGIHSSKGSNHTELESDVARQAIENGHLTEDSHLYYGCLIGAARVVACVRDADKHPNHAILDFAIPGAHHWIFGEVTKFEEPIEYKGNTVLWKLDHRFSRSRSV